MDECVISVKRTGQLQPIIEWGFAQRPGRETAASRSVPVVREFKGGVLVALIHGLGTEAEGAIAAETAAKVLQRYRRQPPGALVKRCHRTLMMSRGVVMALASYRVTEGRLAWLAVGNIMGLLLRTKPGAQHPCERLLAFEGVVGYHLPWVEENEFAVETGDTLVLGSGGLGSRLEATNAAGEPPQSMAERVLEASEGDVSAVLTACLPGRK